MFRSLDFIYSPTRNAEEELAFCTKILGGEAVFSIRGFGTRVAAVRFGEGPLLLLAEHLEGDLPVYVDAEAVRTKGDLEYWVGLALDLD